MSLDTPPPITPPLDKEQTLADLAVMEELLSEAKQVKSELDKATKEGNKEEQKTKTTKLRSLLSQCKRIRRKIEGVTNEPVEQTFTYTDTEGKEQSETITIDIEKEIETFLSFYKTHTIDTPPDFREVIQDIWNRNREQIEQAIKEKGFNTILLIPSSLPNLQTINTKMSEGYEPTKEWTPIKDIKETPQGPRIILLHSQELHQHPVLQQTLNKPATDFSTESLTLSDYLILQRYIFDQTGKHIDTKHTDGLYYFTWLPGSTVPNPKGGFRVVDAYWVPDNSRLLVSADVPGDSSADLGCRLSRSFF